MSRGDSGGVIDGLGPETKPDIRKDAVSNGSTVGDRRRFRCTARGCEGSKLIVLDADWERGHETDLRLGCTECETTTLHEPDHGRPVAYYRWRGAMKRRRAALAHTDADAETGSDADADADADGGGL